MFDFARISAEQAHTQVGVLTLHRTFG